MFSFFSQPRLPWIYRARHIALALLLSSVIGLMITLFLILLLSILHIQVEEAGMQQLFGRQWEEYCNNTPRWFSLASLYAVIKGAPSDGIPFYLSLRLCEWYSLLTYH
ncbi:hypothetical protein LNQ03_30560 [Klebsiella pneumoniae subsp. pneumoniae]|nr:hypothetical protein [Klebsiella pneumoniae subsp. pneumoniae]